jgi:hypothetical protein
MEPERIQELYKQFLANYDEKKTSIWHEKSKEFRDFWNNKIVNNDVTKISEPEIDGIIRILDSRAKGNKKDSISVATTMVPQRVWRQMFSEFKTNEKIRRLLTNLLNAEDESLQMQLIDKLYVENSGRKNSLTGPSANVVNTMLFAYNPTRNISVISLNDRRKVIEYFDFPNGPDFDNDTMGKKVALSNRAIIEGFRNLGLSDPPRTISKFLYADILQYWKPDSREKRIKPDGTEIPIPGKIAEKPTSKSVNYWKVAPGEKASSWEQQKKNGVIAIGWDKLGDLRGKSSKEIENMIRRFYPDSAASTISQFRDFLSIRKGDIIVANHGYSRIVGIGGLSENIVTGKIWRLLYMLMRWNGMIRMGEKFLVRKANGGALYHVLTKNFSEN